MNGEEIADDHSGNPVFRDISVCSDWIQTDSGGLIPGQEGIAVSSTVAAVAERHGIASLGHRHRDIATLDPSQLVRGFALRIIDRYGGANLTFRVEEDDERPHETQPEPAQSETEPAESNPIDWLNDDNLTILAGAGERDQNAGSTALAGITTPEAGQQVGQSQIDTHERQTRAGADPQQRPVRSQPRNRVSPATDATAGTVRETSETSSDSDVTSSDSDVTSSDSNVTTRSSTPARPRSGRGGNVDPSQPTGAVAVPWRPRTNATAQQMVTRQLENGRMVTEAVTRAKSPPTKELTVESRGTDRTPAKTFRERNVSELDSQPESEPEPTAQSESPLTSPSLLDQPAKTPDRSPSQYTARDEERVDSRSLLDGRHDDSTPATESATTERTHTQSTDKPRERTESVAGSATTDAPTAIQVDTLAGAERTAPSRDTDSGRAVRYVRPENQHDAQPAAATVTTARPATSISRTPAVLLGRSNRSAQRNQTLSNRDESATTTVRRETRGPATEQSADERDSDRASSVIASPRSESSAARPPQAGRSSIESAVETNQQDNTVARSVTTPQQTESPVKRPDPARQRTTTAERSDSGPDPTSGSDYRAETSNAVRSVTSDRQSSQRIPPQSPDVAQPTATPQLTADSHVHLPTVLVTTGTQQKATESRETVTGTQRKPTGIQAQTSNRQTSSPQRRAATGGPELRYAVDDNGTDQTAVSDQAQQQRTLQEGSNGDIQLASEQHQSQRHTGQPVSFIEDNSATYTSRSASQSKQGSATPGAGAAVSDPIDGRRARSRLATRHRTPSVLFGHSRGTLTDTGGHRQTTPQESHTTIRSGEGTGASETGQPVANQVGTQPDIPSQHQRSNSVQASSRQPDPQQSTTVSDQPAASPSTRTVSDRSQAASLQGEKESGAVSSHSVPLPTGTGDYPSVSSPSILGVDAGDTRVRAPVRSPTVVERDPAEPRFVTRSRPGGTQSATDADNHSRRQSTASDIERKPHDRSGSTPFGVGGPDITVARQSHSFHLDDRNTPEQSRAGASTVSAPGTDQANTTQPPTDASVVPSLSSEPRRTEQPDSDHDDNRWSQPERAMATGDTRTDRGSIHHRSEQQEKRATAVGDTKRHQQSTATVGEADSPETGTRVPEQTQPTSSDIDPVATETDTDSRVQPAARSETGSVLNSQPATSPRQPGMDTRLGAHVASMRTLDRVTRGSSVDATRDNTSHRQRTRRPAPTLTGEPSSGVAETPVSTGPRQPGDRRIVQQSAQTIESRHSQENRSAPTVYRQQTNAAQTTHGDSSEPEFRPDEPRQLIEQQRQTPTLSDSGSTEATRSVLDSTTASVVSPAPEQETGATSTVHEKTNATSTAIAGSARNPATGSTPATRPTAQVEPASGQTTTPHSAVSTAELTHGRQRPPRVDRQPEQLQRPTPSVLTVDSGSTHRGQKPFIRTAATTPLQHSTDPATIQRDRQRPAMTTRTPDAERGAIPSRSQDGEATAVLPQPRVSTQSVGSTHAVETQPADASSRSLTVGSGDERTADSAVETPAKATDPRRENAPFQEAAHGATAVEDGTNAADGSVSSVHTYSGEGSTQRRTTRFASADTTDEPANYSSLGALSTIGRRQQPLHIQRRSVGERSPHSVAYSASSDASQSRNRTYRSPTATARQQPDGAESERIPKATDQVLRPSQQDTPVLTAESTTGQRDGNQRPLSTGQGSELAEGSIQHSGSGQNNHAHTAQTVTRAGTQSETRARTQSPRTETVATGESGDPERRQAVGLSGGPVTVANRTTHSKLTGTQSVTDGSLTTTVLGRHRRMSTDDSSGKPRATPVTALTPQSPGKLVTGSTATATSSVSESDTQPGETTSASMTDVSGSASPTQSERGQDGHVTMTAQPTVGKLETEMTTRMDKYLTRTREAATEMAATRNAEQAGTGETDTSPSFVYRSPIPTGRTEKRREQSARNSSSVTATGSRTQRSASREQPTPSVIEESGAGTDRSGVARSEQRTPSRSARRAQRPADELNSQDNQPSQRGRGRQTDRPADQLDSGHQDLGTGSHERGRSFVESGSQPGHPQGTDHTSGSRRRRTDPEIRMPEESIEYEADIDRVVERIYRKLERKKRIESERKGQR